jgi:hypothetical protein
MKIQPQPAGITKLDISVRPLQENDLSAADHIMRLAFGTFLGLPDPHVSASHAPFYSRSNARAVTVTPLLCSFLAGARQCGVLLSPRYKNHWLTIRHERTLMPAVKSQCVLAPL